MAKTKQLKLTLAVLSVISLTAQATSTAHVNDRLSINGATGYLSGKAQEFVYDSDTGQKISELIWKINGAAVVKGEANYKLLSWLDGNAQGWITLAPGNSVMDDYDWLVPGQEHWSDWSHHEDTDLSQGNEFNLSLRAWFLQKPNFKLAGMLGYQRTLFNFLAKGGCYNYDNGELIGCFPSGLKGIGYKQTFSTSYIGIASTFLINLFEFNGLFKFSSWVSAHDVDQHYQRDLTFKDSADDIKFYNVTINAGYYVKPSFKLFAEGAYNYFPNTKTSTFIRDNITREVAFVDDGSSGLNNKNFIISLGIQYKGMAG